MTILIGWIGVDSRRPSSAYLMSDSRISWATNPNAYDCGRKLFALRNHPDILGYCGDVLFPCQFLSQIYEMDSNDILFSNSMTSADRAYTILNQLNKQYFALPEHARGDFTIYHISRDLDLSFCAYKYFYDLSTRAWQIENINTDIKESTIIIQAGSGQHAFNELYVNRYKTGDLSGTSRNIHQCLCHMLFQNNEITCGGPPQLVGLYVGKKFNGISFGIINDGQRYFCGSPCEYRPELSSICWYNEEFEICDGLTMQKRPTAARQPNPNR